MSHEVDQHERWRIDAAAYALGSLEQQEVRAFEEHLAGCTRCQAELAEMRSAVDALASAVPARPAPPELKQRVMAEVRADTQQAAAPARSLRFALPISLRPGWAAPLLIAAALVAVAVVGLSLSGGGAVRTYQGIVYAPGASASVRVAGGHSRLVFARLPALPSNRLYEVWVTRGSAPPVPAGALFASTTGTVAVPSGVRAVLVTSEPRPHGSPRPTRSPILVVRLT